MRRGGYVCGTDVDLSEDVHPNFVEMGSRVRIRSGTILFGSEGRPLTIGDDVYINARCVLHGGAARLVIGHRVTLAVGVAIHTDSGPNTSAMLQRDYPIVAADVIVEHDVWIGDYAVILPGVTIGHGSVIGAGTLVRRSVRPHTVVHGNPQRILRRLEDAKHECYVCTPRRPEA
ncbi:acyltransferase [Candidatus Uhrbacteria bacterium]|nr:acyltransferase [Candidatus Uhrbacteria bacterium]